MAYGSIHTTAGSRKKTPVREEARHSGPRVATEVITLLSIGHPRQFAFLRLRNGGHLSIQTATRSCSSTCVTRSRSNCLAKLPIVTESNLDLGISVLGLTVPGAV
jgi:hypothetical protein